MQSNKHDSPGRESVTGLLFALKLASIVEHKRGAITQPLITGTCLGSDKRGAIITIMGIQKRDD